MNALIIIRIILERVSFLKILFILSLRNILNRRQNNRYYHLVLLLNIIHNPNRSINYTEKERKRIIHKLFKLFLRSISLVTHAF